MSGKMKYLIHCMEEYKREKQIKGAEVADLFKTYQVYDYILGCFDALHTTGTKYMIEDIDMYIAAKRAAAYRH